MSSTEVLRVRILDELNLQEGDVFGARSGLTAKYAVNREINSAIRHYESTRFRWNEERESEFATTVDGTRTYSLPSDFVRMDTLKLVYNDAYIDIQKTQWEEIEHRDRDVDGSEGVPTVFAVYGNVLRVYPVPNDAYTLVGSYVRRVGIPTSLTGSFCSVTTMGGASLTVSSTASHNSRLDGWTTDGEELIRARSLASVEINYRHNPDAMSEMRQMAAQRKPYLSYREELAFERLVDEAQDAQSSGLIRAYEI